MDLRNACPSRTVRSPPETCSSIFSIEVHNCLSLRENFCLSIFIFPSPEKQTPSHCRATPSPVYKLPLCLPFVLRDQLKSHPVVRCQKLSRFFWRVHVGRNIWISSHGGLDQHCRCCCCCIVLHVFVLRSSPCRLVVLDGQVHAAFTSANRLIEAIEINHLVDAILLHPSSPRLTSRRMV
jgi:hypothetical protein